jgi:hypothetical protein
LVHEVEMAAVIIWALFSGRVSRDLHG